MSDLMFRVEDIVRRELEVVRSQLLRKRIEVIEVHSGDQTTLLPTAHVLVACGSRPAHGKIVTVDGDHILDSDQRLRERTNDLPDRTVVVGAETGMLKLLFDLETKKLLGVHGIGDGGVELVHIGQAILAMGGPIPYFRDTVFNYPTLAEAYKVSALEGLNTL